MSIVWPDLTRPVSEESELLVWPINITYNFLLEVHWTGVVFVFDAFVVVVACYCHCRRTNHYQLLIGSGNYHGSWSCICACCAFYRENMEVGSLSLHLLLLLLCCHCWSLCLCCCCCGCCCWWYCCTDQLFIGVYNQNLAVGSTWH